MTDSKILKKWTPSDVLAELGGSVQVDANGWAWGPLRVERGGGIACHGGDFWITFPGEPELTALGPYRTQRALRAGIKQVIVRSLRFGLALMDLEDTWSGVTSAK